MPPDLTNPLKKLDLSGNSIDGPDIWEWDYEHRKTTETNLKNTFPLCDCKIIGLFE